MGLLALSHLAAGLALSRLAAGLSSSARPETAAQPKNENASNESLETRPRADARSSSRARIELAP